MRLIVTFFALVTLLSFAGCASDKKNVPVYQVGWRRIPLVNEEGKMNPDWKFTGFGSFAIEGDALRTVPDGRGLGLLVYTKEKFGDCRLRVVYRVENDRSNSGVYIRIDDGILEQIGKQQIAVTRDADGKLSDEEASKMEMASELEQGPWYAVHHGFEVQIADGGDLSHGTGAIYSLANRLSKPITPSGEWRTMIITLRGNQVEVELDGRPMCRFDSSSKDLPPRKVWHEPKRESPRPTVGYIGFQTHDPGDIVWFRELSVAKVN